MLIQCRLVLIVWFLWSVCVHVCLCVCVVLWEEDQNELMLACSYPGKLQILMKHFPSLLHASSQSHFPRSTPLPPSPTVICVSFVTILLLSCVSCKAMIVFSFPQDGRSSLMLASQNGHHEVVKVSLSACANVDLQDNVSTTSPIPKLYGDLCYNVILYCGLEGYVHTTVMEIIWDVYTCVGLLWHILVLVWCVEYY